MTRKSGLVEEEGGVLALQTACGCLTRNQEAGGAILCGPTQTHVTHKVHRKLHPRVPDTRASGAHRGGVQRRTRSAERQRTKQ